MALNEIDDIDAIEQIAFKGIGYHARLGSESGAWEKTFPGIDAGEYVLFIGHLGRNASGKPLLWEARPRVDRGEGAAPTQRTVPHRAPLQRADPFYAPSLAFTMADTLAISARPASLGLSSAMTLPMSCIALAPAAATATATSAAISASVICWGI